jgi:hypothetical protein
VARARVAESDAALAAAEAERAALRCQLEEARRDVARLEQDLTNAQQASSGDRLALCRHQRMHAAAVCSVHFGTRTRRVTWFLHVCKASEGSNVYGSRMLGSESREAGARLNRQAWRVVGVSSVNA